MVTNSNSLTLPNPNFLTPFRTSRHARPRLLQCMTWAGLEPLPAAPAATLSPSRATLCNQPACRGQPPCLHAHPSRLDMPCIIPLNMTMAFTHPSMRWSHSILGECNHCTPYKSVAHPPLKPFCNLDTPSLLLQWSVLHEAMPQQQWLSEGFAAEEHTLELSLVRQVVTIKVSASHSFSKHPIDHCIWVIACYSFPA